MPDLSQVETAIAQAVDAVVYPNGDGAAAIVPGIVSIARGWPVNTALDEALKAGNCKITIFSDPNTSRNATRYLLNPVVQPGTATLSTSVSGATVAIAGLSSPTHIVGIRIGGEFGQTYAYRAVSNDTPATIAGQLAAMIPSAAASGGNITIATNQIVEARIAVDGSALLEQRRQEQVIRVTFWCPDPAKRDALAAAVDAALAATPWLPIASDLPVRLRYRGTASFDGGENADLYRRDLTYTAEYATTTQQTTTSNLFVNVSTNDNPISA